MPTGLTEDQLYSAFASKDARFDGHFFVGVRSTGIYCRPVCTAKMPRRENCVFFASAAEAEAAGFRPCLTCRPELAPGLAPVDANASLARRAAALLQEDCASRQSLEALAGRLGCTSRHLRRVFGEEYRITPVQYLQTCRLLLAKELLTDTGLPVSQVARTAGFGSTRRMNDLFRTQYHLTPSALRKQARASGTPSRVMVNLGYRPPYRFAELLGFLELRAIPGVETVRDGRYYRTARHLTAQGSEVAGWISVGHNPRRQTLSVEVSASLLPVLPRVLAQVRRLFDLGCQPEPIYQALAGSMNALKPGLCVEGTRVPGCYDPFETAVRAILGQQITVKAASTLAGRMANRLGTPVETGVPNLTRLFPTASELASHGEKLVDELGQLGVVSARGRSIVQLAHEVAAGSISLDPFSDVSEQIEQLLSLKGIGPWTAQYIAMRSLSWPDSFMETDVGIKHALAPMTPKEALAASEAWRPWRSYAMLNLWNSLG